MAVLSGHWDDISKVMFDAFPQLSVSSDSLPERNPVRTSKNAKDKSRTSSPDENFYMALHVHVKIEFRPRAEFMAQDLSKREIGERILCSALR